MHDSFESTGSNATGQCSWCDGPVGLFGHVSNGVCSHCYGLMNAAGMPDAEIYGRKAGDATGEAEDPVIP